MDKRIIRLLDQIIEKAKEEDEEHKRRAISMHRASQSVGESWVLFHLKELRSLISENE